MKIYTKTGDEGTSSIGFKRLPKNHIYFKTLGSVDLLNSNIGMLIYLLHAENISQYKTTTEFLSTVQSNLMSLSSYLIGYLNINLTSHTTTVENHIDDLEKNNTPLANFILPQGSLPAVNCHALRALCRQVEINIVELLSNADCQEVLTAKYSNNYKQINSSVLQYVNRLSDYFFVLARSLNNNGNNDVIWRV